MMDSKPDMKSGVMGWPISHSLSPKLHGYWLQKYQIAGSYRALAVPPDELAQQLRNLAAMGFRGCNLTLPHKETAMTLVDVLDDEARRIGAVNTIVVLPDGRLEGRNSDHFGFAENLRAGGLSTGVGQKAVVLGAGGAARAVLVALQAMQFAEIILINRSPERAHELARLFATQACPIRVCAWEEKDLALSEAALLVNTTALGMKGQPDLIINLDHLPATATVTDIVYTPLMTPLLRDAAARELRVIDGLGMLLHQGRAGFKAWFGIDPEVDTALRNYMLGDA